MRVVAECEKQWEAVGAGKRQWEAVGGCGR